MATRDEGSCGCFYLGTFRHPHVTEQGAWPFETRSRACRRAAMGPSGLFSYQTPENSVIFS